MKKLINFLEQDPQLTNEELATMLGISEAEVDAQIKDLKKKGVIRGVHSTDMMTSGQFASEGLQAGNLPVNGKKYYVFGTANFKKPDEKIPAIFAGSPYELVSDLHDADFIYCGIPQLLDDELFPYDSTEIDDFVVQVKALVESDALRGCAAPLKRVARDKSPRRDVVPAYAGDVVTGGEDDLEPSVELLAVL